MAVKKFTIFCCVFSISSFAVRVLLMTLLTLIQIGVPAAFGLLSVIALARLYGYKYAMAIPIERVEQIAQKIQEQRQAERQAEREVADAKKREVPGLKTKRQQQIDHLVRRHSVLLAGQESLIQHLPRLMEAFVDGAEISAPLFSVHETRYLTTSEAKRKAPEFIWHTADRSACDIRQMGDAHLRNAIAHLERQHSGRSLISDISKRRLANMKSHFQLRQKDAVGHWNMYLDTYSYLW